jgi:guanylate kinase
MTGKIIVASAASGAGKTTLLDHVRECFPQVVYSISATTRAPRAGEVHGQHYFFLSRQDFEQQAAQGRFAEWQVVHGNYYGTPRGFIDDSIAGGRHVVMDIDVYGKKKFDVVFPQAIGILLLPPSMEELERRLRGRGTDSEEVIARRLTNARDEMAFAREHGSYQYTIVNDDLDRAREEIVATVKEIIGE